jgi:ADP-ribose pyrophosphatase
VEEHSVELPDGTIIEKWPWVASPDFVLVLGITPERKFMVFHQTKYAVDVMVNQDTLAPVGGYLEPDEDPEEAALRELQEETGYQSDHLMHLSSTVVDGNRGGGMGHLYLALNATFKEKIESDDLEEQNLLLMSREELEAALDAGEFRVSVWALLIALALRRLDNSPS